MSSGLKIGKYSARWEIKCEGIFRIMKMEEGKLEFKNKLRFLFCKRLLISVSATSLTMSTCSKHFVAVRYMPRRKLWKGRRILDQKWIVGKIGWKLDIITSSCKKHVFSTSARVYTYIFAQFLHIFAWIVIFTILKIMMHVICKIIQ